jgi:hypothetical protein
MNQPLMCEGCQNMSPDFCLEFVNLGRGENHDSH